MKKIYGVVDDNDNNIMMWMSAERIVSKDFRDGKKKWYFQTELSSTVRLPVPELKIVMTSEFKSLF